MLEQWQFEVTGAGRIWYAIDDQNRIVVLTLATVGHPANRLTRNPCHVHSRVNRPPKTAVELYQPVRELYDELAAAGPMSRRSADRLPIIDPDAKE